MTPVFDNDDSVSTVSGANGKDEGVEFICSRDKRTQARFRYLLARLRDGDRIKSPENIRHLSSDDPAGNGAQVYELKVPYGPGWRLYVVKYSGRWFVTHGNRKPKDSQVPKHIKRAFDIFNADL